MIKAAFFDVDGTLVSIHTKYISDKLVADLAELRRRGILIFLATGRAKPDIEKTGMLKSAEFDGYITLSGQYCYNENGLYRDVPICKSDLENAVRILRENPDIAARMEAGEVTGLTQINDRVRELDRYMHTALYEIHPPEWMLDRKIYQFVPLVHDGEEQRFLSVMPNCVWTRWHPKGLDILPKGDAKADGIRATMELYSLRQDEIIVFGDGDNDLSMFAMAGTSVAMGNASGEVKAAADHVTDTVENDGICQALRYSGLL